MMLHLCLHRHWSDAYTKSIVVRINFLLLPVTNTFKW